MDTMDLHGSKAATSVHSRDIAFSWQRCELQRCEGAEMGVAATAALWIGATMIGCAEGHGSEFSGR
jgi:hypothetical protein